MKWLNSSCLGDVKQKQGRYKLNIENDIIEIFSKLENWIIEWTGYKNGVVGFVESTTAACDAVLMALSDHSQIFIHTSSAHPTIRHSIQNMAKIIGHIRKSNVDVYEIDLGKISWADDNSVANAIVEQVLAITDMQKSIFVLDHVTYDYGIQLPVKLIAEKLEKLRPNIKIVIDAAQSVALWRTHKLNVAGYIGCFHKYVAAPAATGFLIIPKELRQWLPPHVQTITHLPEQLELLPTLDLLKWSKTADVLCNNVAIVNVEKQVSKIENFNKNLEELIFPYTFSFGINYESNFRSHISSLEFKKENDAEIIKVALFSKGYEVQRFGKVIRISIGKNISILWAVEIGRIIKDNIETKGLCLL